MQWFPKCEVLFDFFERVDKAIFCCQREFGILDMKSKIENNETQEGIPKGGKKGSEGKKISEEKYLF